MNTIMANSFELKGTNYEIGVQLGRTVLNNSHLRDIFISKSQSIQVDECDIYELFDRYCPGLNEELLIEIMDGIKEIDFIQNHNEKNFLIATNHTHIESLTKAEPYAMKNSLVRYRCLEEWIAQNPLISEYDIKELLLTPYPNGLMLPYYDDFLGTIKSIVFDLNLGKVDICWCGLYENEWHSYYVDANVNSASYSQSVKKQLTPPDFFTMANI